MKRNLRPNLVSLLVLMLSYCGLAAAHEDCRTLSDIEVVQRLVFNSRNNFSGPCPCPDDRDNWGRRCGSQSAWSQPGPKPLCFAYDVTEDYIYRFRQNCDAKHYTQYEYSNVDYKHYHYIPPHEKAEQGRGFFARFFDLW